MDNGLYICLAVRASIMIFFKFPYWKVTVDTKLGVMNSLFKKHINVDKNY